MRIRLSLLILSLAIICFKNEKFVFLRELMKTHKKLLNLPMRLEWKLWNMLI